MIILIDGYNILKNIAATHEIDEHTRRTFLTLLGKYAYRKKHKLIVVFDGGPYEWVHKEKIDGVMVVYSGRFESADDSIMRYLDDNCSKNILLVSSDNEVARYAHELEIPSIGSLDFFGLVKDGLRNERPIADQEVSVTLESDTNELDAIMREASHIVPIKQEDRPPEIIKTSSKRMSRTEKKLYAILKKL